MRRALFVGTAMVVLGCGATSAPPRVAQQRASADPVASVTPSSSAPVSPEEARVAAIKARFGNSCRLARECAGMWGIDCDAAVDGPFYYVEAQTLKVVAQCGGYCVGGRCTECPPRTWTCATR